MPFGIDSSVFDILIGALITILSTMVAWALLHFNQRRVDRDRTRRAILHEVNHIADNVERLIDLETGTAAEDSIDLAVIMLSADVLEEDFRQVNKLTSPEVRSVYEFYELTRVLKRKLRRQEQREETTGKNLGYVAEKIVNKRDEINRRVTRSRMSLLTEWYKERDRRRRNRVG